MTPTAASDQPTEPVKRRVLVTGAAGGIGSYFAEHSHSRYDLRLMDLEPALARNERLAQYGEVISGDITDLAQMQAACEGIDTVIHLAATPDPAATWDELLPLNIEGTYNTFTAAQQAECRRVVYASSVHAIAGYPSDIQVKTNEQVNPLNLYGVSKCFGEALGRYFAEQLGISVIALRIGAFQPRDAARDPDSLDMMNSFVSRRDLCHLIQCCIDVEDLKFAILHGMSDNVFKRADISDARTLVGYSPQDDYFKLNPVLAELHLDEYIGPHRASK
jgi:nucleoside-diphosphate-sugar epimerase